MFDVFISYSRKDNNTVSANGATAELGWLEKLVDDLKAKHRAFTTDELRIFVDRGEIHCMDDWRHRILDALRNSVVLIACVSPNYFASPYCRWEWEEYVRTESARALGQEGIAPLYLCDARVPGSDDQWIRDIQRRQRIELHGPAALEALDEQIYVRLERKRRASRAKGNVARRVPGFIGRGEQLSALREKLACGPPGTLAIVQGLAGMGKTALTTEYAHSCADRYGGGRWFIDCGGRTDLRDAFVSLAPAIGVSLSAEESANLDLAFARVVTALEKVSSPDPASSEPCLIILDNVDEASLFASTNLAQIPSASWLQLVATTQLDPTRVGAGGADRIIVTLDELPADDALALLELHQPSGRFACELEREAARKIAVLLGGVPIAIEAAAVFLGLYPDVTSADFLARLVRESTTATETVGRDPNVASRTRHRDKTMALALAATLQRLPPEERWVLELASQLPPTQVPLAWLRELASLRFQHLAEEPVVGYPNAWLRVERRLTGLRMLVATGASQVSRMHRLVQDIVRDQSNAAAEQRRAVLDYAGNRAQRWKNHLFDPSAQWELEPLRDLAHTLFGDEHVEFVRNVVHCLIYRVRLLEAEALMQPQHSTDGRASLDPARAQFELGQIALMRGQFGSASLFAQGLLRGAAKEEGAIQELSAGAARLLHGSSLFKLSEFTTAEEDFCKAK
ncbi:MAG TPA: toll/interleukin-1 receptor domain-containing protein, partial [Polyangiaceae bacterium]|nr:toll/interleukin-1 receptor domain-containing protein [Polyangiaceae bacterium]